MHQIVLHQHALLTHSLGLNIWGGQYPQTMNSEAVTWALAKELYSWKGPYAIISLSLAFGFIATTCQYVLHRVSTPVALLCISTQAANEMADISKHKAFRWERDYASGDSHSAPIFQSIVAVLPLILGLTQGVLDINVRKHVVNPVDCNHWRPLPGLAGEVSQGTVR